MSIFFTAGTILNDTIYIKKNNLNTHYKNYFKSSLTKTKEDIKEIKMKYRKKAKIYKE